MTIEAVRDRLISIDGKVDELAEQKSTEATSLAIKAALDAVTAKLGNGTTHVIIDSMPAGGAALTDSELRAEPVPVAGTVAVSNLPATQPVSGTVSVGNFPSSQAVTGTFWQATQPVSAASLPLPTGAATDTVSQAIRDRLPTSLVSGRLDVNVGASTSLAVTGPLTDAQLRAANVPVQVKDSGRVRCCIKYHGTSSATADTLQTLTKNLGGTETAGQSTGVTSGKRLKITSVVFALAANAAAAAFGTMNLRSNAAGATVIGSPSLLRIPVGNTANVAGSSVQSVVACDLEFSGTETLGISTTVQATTNILSITLIGYEYTP